MPNLNYLQIFALPSVLVAVVAYLLGSISFSIIFTRIFDNHADIRTMGSGNAGATNVLRSVGAKAAAFTFVFDFAKGAVSVLIGRYVFYFAGMQAGISSGMLYFISQYGAYIAGVLCVIGHIYPVYFGFKGGKGVLTCAAMIALIDWRVFIPVICVFIIVFFISRIVSLSSICAASALPIVTFLVTFFADYRAGSASSTASITYVAVTTAISLLMAMILIYKHRSNIQRIRKGEEKKISIHKKTN